MSRPRGGLSKSDGFFDWTPVLAGPDVETPDIRPLASDLDHARTSDRPQRNGLPEGRPYAWRPGESEREAVLAERLEAIRAVAAQRASEPQARPGRQCRDCANRAGTAACVKACGGAR